MNCLRSGWPMQHPNCEWICHGHSGSLSVLPCTQLYLISGPCSVYTLVSSLGSVAIILYFPSIQKRDLHGNNSYCLFLTKLMDFFHLMQILRKTISYQRSPVSQQKNISSHWRTRRTRWKAWVFHQSLRTWWFPLSGRTEKLTMGMDLCETYHTQSVMV
jgi:hypothetical protein